MKRIALSLFIIGILAFSTPGNVAAFNIPVNLNIGDVFKIRITNASVEHKINGTEYFDTDMPELSQLSVNQIAEMKITAIYDEGKSTYVNVTGNAGELKIEGTVEVDEWMFGLGLLLFLILAQVYFNPDNYDFSAPTDTTITSVDKIDPLPIFASSNETQYTELVNKYNSSETTTTTTTSTSTNPNITMAENIFDVNYNSAEKFFNFTIIIDITNHGVNSKGDSWSTHMIYKYITYIDVARSFVFKYLLELKYEVNIGSASSLAFMSIGWDNSTETQDEGGILGLPGFELYISLTALLAVPIIIKKYRK